MFDTSAPPFPAPAATASALSTSRAFIYDCFLTLPLVVGLGALAGGADLALRTAIAGMGVLLNLPLAERATRRFVRNAAVGDDPAAPGALLLKQLTTLPLALVLMVVVGAQAVALAFGSLFVGIVVYAAVQALQARDASVMFGPASALKESAC
jgi:hypothetical protein